MKHDRQLQIFSYSITNLSNREWRSHLDLELTLSDDSSCNLQRTVTEWQTTSETFLLRSEQWEVIKCCCFKLLCPEDTWYVAISKFRIVHAVVAWPTWSYTAIANLLLLVASSITGRYSCPEDTAQKNKKDDSLLCIIFGQGCPMTKLLWASYVINPSNRSFSHFPKT